MPARLVIPRLSDMHVHFRRHEMMRMVVPATAAQCGYVVVMPNTKPGIYTGLEAKYYAEEINRVPGAEHLELVMSMYITPKTTPEQIYKAWEMGVRNCKIYPKDLTNNAEDGVEDYYALKPLYKAMQNCGMVLSLHGERPGQNIYCVEREQEFLPILRWIAANFPNLRIVMEHITTEAAVRAVQALGPNVAATITLHHLFITLNDLMEPKLHPHLFCKPLAKREMDRQALIRAVLSGNPKFFLGSDTAPHLRSTKECADCCAGVYTATVLAPMLVEFFQNYNRMDRMPNFASFFGPQFYGLEPPEGVITVEEESWRVPQSYEMPVEDGPPDALVPFWAGKIINWQVVS